MYNGQIERIIEVRDVNSKAINTHVLAATAFGSTFYFLLIAWILGWAAFRSTGPPCSAGSCWCCCS